MDNVVNSITQVRCSQPYRPVPQVQGSLQIQRTPLPVGTPQAVLLGDSHLLEGSLRELRRRVGNSSYSSQFSNKAVLQRKTNILFW